MKPHLLRSRYLLWFSLDCTHTEHQFPIQVLFRSRINLARQKTPVYRMRVNEPKKAPKKTNYDNKTIFSNVLEMTFKKFPSTPPVTLIS